MELRTGRVLAAIEIDYTIYIISPRCVGRKVKVMFELVRIVGAFMVDYDGVFVSELSNFRGGKFVVNHFKEHVVFGSKIFGGIFN